MSKSSYFVWGLREWDDPGFVQIPRPFLENYRKAGLNSVEAMIVIQLSSFRWVKPGSRIFPSMQKIAKRMGLSRRQIRFIINGRQINGKKYPGLIDKGLRIKNRAGNTHLYDLKGISERCVAVSKKTLTEITDEIKSKYGG